MQVDEYFSKGSVLSRPACVPGLCAGTLMAGLDITVGVFIDLEMSAYIDIDAQAELVYNRRLEATGTFGMHTLGLAVNFHKSDFRLELNQDRGADPRRFRRLRFSKDVGQHDTSALLRRLCKHWRELRWTLCSCRCVPQGDGQVVSAGKFRL